jgi:hypothetical protein
MTAESTLLLLAPRELHSIDDAANVRISCRSGSVWITLDNDNKDYVLEAGESFTASVHARALVYALGTARVDLTECQSRKDTTPMFNRFHAMPLMKAAR